MSYVYGDPPPKEPKSLSIAQSQIVACKQRETEIRAALEHSGSSEWHAAELATELNHLIALRLENER